MAFLLLKSKEMINSFLIFIKKIFYSNKLIIEYFKKNLMINNFSFDHQNIFFNDNENIKRIILSQKKFDLFNNEYKNTHHHTFDWLILAKKTGGAESLYFSKKQIIKWSQNNYSTSNIIWSNYYCSKRLINLVYSYNFYAITAAKNEIEIFNQIIIKHYLINDLLIKNTKIKQISIEDTKANLLLCLICNKDISGIITVIKNQLLDNIDNHGFHKSYNPISQAKYINHLREIKNMLLFFDAETIDELNFQIVNMTSVLNNFFHKDGSIALFNGSHNLYNKKILSIIKQCEDIKIKNLYSINNGIAIYDDKNKKIFFDVVKPTNKFINKNLHASTLSFEYSTNNEKIITNCGSIERYNNVKPEYLRYSAAHSTIILQNTNISELIKKDAYVRIPKNIKFDFFENDENVIFEASHDGYNNNFKTIIKRKLVISKKYNQITGTDTIMPIKVSTRKNLYNIRFHLASHCQCIMTNSKQKIIIKTKNKKKFVFESSSKLSIDESISIEDGKKVFQNKQIVISGFINNVKKIETWSIKTNEK